MLVLLASLTLAQTTPPPTSERVALPGQLPAGHVHYDLEQAYHQARFEDGLALARERLAQHPDDVDLHWMVARFLYEIGEQYLKTDAPFDKEEHYEAMLEVSEAGLALAPEHPHLLFAKGIALGRLGTTRGILASLFMARKIEGAWTDALEHQPIYASLGGEEILPCDLHVGLGSYYRMVPDWWIVQVLAGTRGDLDKAITHLETANTCSPDRVEILKELGVAYVCAGQHRKDDALVHQGLDTLRRAQGLPATKPTDVIDLEHVSLLLSEPDLACEYSRDGQADLDRKKLEKGG